MAAIGEIRKRSWLLVVVIVIGMLAFILGDTFSGAGGGIQDSTIATVNGNNITQSEYNEMVEREFRKTEKVYRGFNNDEEPPASMKTQFRETYLTSYLNKQLFQAEFDKLGIEISPTEFNDMLMGNNIDGSTYEKYGMFTGPDRRFSEDSLKKNINRYLENENYRYFIENMIGEDAENSRLQSKYFNMISQGIYATSYEGKMDFQAKNNSTDFEYVRGSYASVKDSEIEVTDSDLEAYYNKHKSEKKYKQEDKVSFQSVDFAIEPSDDDLDIARHHLVQRIELFKDADNDTSFIVQNSDSKNFDFSIGTFPEEIDSVVQAAQNGDVIGPYRDGDFFKISKVIDNSFEKEAKVRHILLSNNTYQANPALQQKRADSLVTALKRNRNGFTNAVKKFSDDPGSKEKGGVYEWFDDKQMVPEFTKVSFEDPIGTVTQTRTNYGIHVIEVLDRRDTEKKKLRVATVDSEIRRSKETIDMVREKAIEFISLFEDTDEISDTAFRNAATKNGLSVIPYNDISISTTEESMPELKEKFENNFMQVKKWAFNKYTDEGEISDDFVFEKTVKVARLISKSKAGISSFDELSQTLKSEITRKVTNEKKAAYLVEKMKGSSLSEVAKAVGTFIDTANGITINRPAIQGAGVEPAVVGSAFGMKTNVLSQPIIGETGVFVILVKNRVDAPIEDNNFEPQKDEVKQKLRQGMQNVVYEALKDLNGLENNREKVNVMGR